MFSNIVLYDTMEIILLIMPQYMTLEHCYLPPQAWE